MGVEGSKIKWTFGRLGSIFQAFWFGALGGFAGFKILEFLAWASTLAMIPTFAVLWTDCAHVSDFSVVNFVGDVELQPQLHSVKHHSTSQAA